ncbi:hypothetical protein EIN_093590 [Entamoeba invadens IP1]|uniref:Uncharacterized protein n=1 Tax=Entamoeba invadens IP1 TaxID=370355 RepID=A0A0A1TZY6_ENTIV|nr:hypothetical protein EIN_093590 [Entamoeba invadens IP1]ELP87202.1 hypothetical protein EIN_093590 [Entamoeba invadens IP1]|eukprot:XP_004253973.1 hypothetical protein EIN_093590 [Entamoeba invadens IP1]
MKRVVAICFTNTHVGASYYQTNNVKTELMRPIPFAISFTDNKINVFGDAMKQKQCLSGLCDTEKLGIKINRDETTRKFVTNVFELWVVMVCELNNKLTQILSNEGLEAISYLVTIPEGCDQLLKDVVSLAFKKNGMDVCRIVTNDIACAFNYAKIEIPRMFEHNSFEKHWEVVVINLDDRYTAVSLFDISITKVTKIYMDRLQLGQQHFARRLCEMALKSPLESDDVDDWNFKMRKRVDEFYDAINMFSDVNVSKSFVKDEEDNYINFSREEVENLFINEDNSIANLVDSVIQTGRAIKKEVGIPIEEDKDIVLCVVGMHKNSFVEKTIIENLSSKYRVANNMSINAKTVCLEGAGYLAKKMELKNKSDHQLMEEYDSNKFVEVDCVIPPQQFTMNNYGAFPEKYVLASECIKLPNGEKPFEGQLVIFENNKIYGEDYQLQNYHTGVGLVELKPEEKYEELYIKLSKYLCCFGPVTSWHDGNNKVPYLERAENYGPSDKQLVFDQTKAEDIECDAFYEMKTEKCTIEKISYNFDEQYMTSVKPEQMLSDNFESVLDSMKKGWGNRSVTSSQSDVVTIQHQFELHEMQYNMDYAQLDILLMNVKQQKLKVSQVLSIKSQIQNKEMPELAQKLEKAGLKTEKLEVRRAMLAMFKNNFDNPEKLQEDWNLLKNAKESLLPKE